MGSAGMSFDLETGAVQRSKEENQERAFVAASRRKDRSIDARLESAQRASQLHKKRTGKCLHITKEIVEREAMYEEVDERYHEKRMAMLKAHTTQLEEQFRQHLMAAMAFGGNGARRISTSGGIQKMRSDVSSAQSYFARRPQQPITPQTVSPETSVSTSPYALPPSPTESYDIHSPGSCYVQTPQQYPQYSCQQQMPGYIAQPLTPLTPSWNQPSTISFQQFLTPQQSLHSLETYTEPPFRPRIASVPDILLLQQQAQIPISVPEMTRAQSEPSQPEPVPERRDSLIPPTLSSTPAASSMTHGLSPPPMTANSSQTSYGDELSTAPDPCHLSKQPILGITDSLDPEYHDFFDFAANMGTQWQMPVPDTCLDDWVNSDSLEYELPATM